MLVYVLICLCLSLAGVAGLQFFYMAYLERVERQHKKRIAELERHCKYLSKRLKKTEQQLADQAEILEKFYEDLEFEEEEEIWADVIDEK
jgi:regulator of sirC expression with transglutaminase-like and TPR domain